MNSQRLTCPRPSAAALFCLGMFLAAPGCKRGAPAATAASPSGAVASVAAPQAGEATPPGTDDIARVTVTNQGAITLNGRSVTLDQLKAAFANPAALPKKILYQRANRKEDPAPEATAVVHAVLLTLTNSKVEVRMGPDL